MFYFVIPKKKPRADDRKSKTHWSIDEEGNYYVQFGWDFYPQLSEQIINHECLEMLLYKISQQEGCLKVRGIV